MIVAAASGKPMQGKQGPFYITEEVIADVLSGLDGSFFRIQRLASSTPGLTQLAIQVGRDPVSRTTRTHLWDGGPFRREGQELTVDAGRMVHLDLVSQRLSQSEHVQIGFFKVAGPARDPFATLTRVASSSLKALGITDVQPVGSRWRGRNAVEAAGVADTSEGKIWTSVRVIDAPEHKGIWQLIASSSRSQMDAIGFREYLERAIQLDRD